MKDLNLKCIALNALKKSRGDVFCILLAFRTIQVTFSKEKRIHSHGIKITVTEMKIKSKKHTNKQRR